MAESPPCSRTVRAGMTGMLLAALSACHTYVPLSPDPGTGASNGPSLSPDLERGDWIQLHLSELRPVELRDVTVNQVGLVRGEFVQWERPASDGDGEFVLSAFLVRDAGGRDYRAGGVTVRIPSRSIARLETRKLALGQTLLATLPFGAAAALIPTLVTGGESGGGGGGGPPAPQ